MSRREVKKAPKAAARPLPSTDANPAKSQKGRKGAAAPTTPGHDSASRWDDRSTTGAGRGRDVGRSGGAESAAAPSASYGNIGNFANEETRALFHHRGVDGPAPDERLLKSLRKQVPGNIWPVAQRKLDMIAAAKVPGDLMAPRGNKFEMLKGTDKQYSIRINEQYRITFRFEHGRFVDVKAWDYHDLMKTF